MKAIWVDGLMPIQLLVIFFILAAIFIIGNAILTKAGKRIPAFPQYILIWIATYVSLRYMIYPTIPATLLYTYMGLVSIVVFLLISVNEKMWSEFKRPIVNTMMAEGGPYKTVRLATFVFAPLLAGLGMYNFLNPNYEEPIELRVVHPAPPQSITFEFGDEKGRKVMLQTEQNPYRVDDQGEYLKVGEEAKYFGTNPFADDAPKFMQYVREGGSIFFQNCHFCHGDNLNGEGMFAFAFNPIRQNISPGRHARTRETMRDR